MERAAVCLMQVAEGVRRDIKMKRQTPEMGTERRGQSER